MKRLVYILLLSFSISSYGQDDLRQSYYLINYEMGYYNARERNAEGFNIQASFGVQHNKNVYSIYLQTGLGTRLGKSVPSDLGEALIEEIFFPYRYGIIGVQYGYEVELTDRLSLEPHLGTSALLIDDTVELNIPLSSKLNYQLNRMYHIGASANYNFNSINNFYTINLFLLAKI